MAKPKIISYCKFIDPANAGSFVGYQGKLQQDEYGAITLTFADCTRKVDFDIRLTDKRDGLKKVRNCIAVLQKLEKELEAFKG